MGLHNAHLRLVPDDVEEELVEEAVIVRELPQRRRPLDERVELLPEPVGVVPELGQLEVEQAPELLSVSLVEVFSGADEREVPGREELVDMRVQQLRRLPLARAPTGFLI